MRNIIIDNYATATAGNFEKFCGTSKIIFLSHKKSSKTFDENRKNALK
jgi:hypothetical protein